MLVKVRDVVGENAITREAGMRVYKRIWPALRASRNVELDFDGVKVYASPFLNSAIGLLYKDVSGEDLSKHLLIRNMSAAGRGTLTVVIESARRYYASPEAQHVMDEAVAQELIAEA
jgi:hypothetical protein